MKLAKQSLMDPIDMAQLKQRGAQSDIEQLRIDIYDAGQCDRSRRAGAGRPLHRARR